MTNKVYEGIRKVLSLGRRVPEKLSTNNPDLNDDIDRAYTEAEKAFLKCGINYLLNRRDGSVERESEGPTPTIVRKKGQEELSRLVSIYHSSIKEFVDRLYFILHDVSDDLSDRDGEKVRRLAYQLRDNCRSPDIQETIRVNQKESILDWFWLRFVDY